MDFLRDSLVQFFITTFLTILGLLLAVYGVLKDKADKARKQPTSSVQTRPYSSATPTYNSYPLPTTTSPSSAPCLIVAGTVICVISISCFLVAGPVYNFVANVISTVTHNVTSGSMSGFGNTPNDTLGAFCSDIQSGAYQEAYAQYSNKLQQEQTYAQFQQTWSNKNVGGGCGYDPVQPSSNTATTTLTTTDFFTKAQTSFHVSLIKDSNGNWKIDRFQQV